MKRAKQSRNQPLVEHTQTSLPGSFQPLEKQRFSSHLPCEAMRVSAKKKKKLEFIINISYLNF